MPDLGTIIPAAGLGGAASWIGQSVVAYFRSRTDRDKHKADVDTTLKVHTDKLTFELLHAAREEVAAARIEAAEVRTMQLRLVHFDEALEHIEMLMNAKTPDDRADAERRANQYLIRMKRFSEAHGTMKNEFQVQLSREATGGIAEIDVNLNGKLKP